jgi:fructose-bisphosphate aldolase class 1
VSDIKLFRFEKGLVTELGVSSVAIEKSLQALIEKHLEALLGVRFLASEYSTGKTHGGRIDTLGIDENGYPVIVEYKRALNQRASRTYPADAQADLSAYKASRPQWRAVTSYGVLKAF